MNIKPGASIDIEAQVDLGNLAIGSHRIYVRVRDDKGNWSPVELQEFTIAVPRMDATTPTSGGNVGDVTVNILGASFDEGTKLKLTQSGKPDIEVPDSVMTIINGEQIQAILDLRGKAVGEYNVVAILTDGSELLIPNGFSIVEGISADPWVEIIGFDRIRRGQWQTYTITYGNRGNVDASGVPLWIQIPIDSEYKLDFEVYVPESNSIMWDTIPGSFIADTIHGEPETARIIPLVIPYMAPNDVRTLTFNLKTDVTNTFNISAWVSRPMYQSPLNPDVIDCYADIAAAVIGAVRVVGCLYNILDLGLRPLFKVATTGNNGWFSGDNGLFDSNGKFKAGDFFKSITLTTLGCIPTGRLIGTAEKTVNEMVAVGYMGSGANAVASCTIPFLPKEPKKNKQIQPVASFDPNDKLGLEGAGVRKYIQGTELFPYLIRFENKASATAAAQTVLIIDTLDTNRLDISTLQLGFFSFNDVIVNVPPGRKDYIAHVDLRPANDLIVKIEAKLDEEKGILTWMYTSLDPITRQPTENPEVGFLPPNITAPEGEGGVFYTVRPKSGLSTSVEVKNKAYIFFDNNEVIPTPTWANSIDISPPISNVSTLPEVQNDSTFTVSWSGTDEGAGIKSYSIYVAVNDQPYKLWLENATTTSELFTGKPDSTYHFYSIARDSTGITELSPSIADATTTITQITGIVDELERLISIYPNPAFHTLIVELPTALRESTLSLINIQGSKVMEVNMNNKTSIELPVSQFAKGLYLLRISSDDVVITKKVLIR